MGPFYLQNGFLKVPYDMKIGSLRGLLTVPYIIGIAGYLKTANVFNDIRSVSPPLNRTP